MTRGRVLLTGGAGFLGTHLAERLREEHDLVLLDNLRRDSLQHAPSLRDDPRVRLVKGDVRDEKLVSAALEGVETVLHLAAIAGVSDYYKEPLRVLETNLLGTANVVACAARAGVRRFVFFSTSEVYGAQALDAREDDPCAVGPPSDRRWVYATTKLAGEHLVLRTAEEHGFAATVVRPFNIYGARQTGEGAISNFCAAATKGEPLEVHGEGSSIRAWCHVDDLVAGVLAALSKPEAAGQIFNIGSPTEVETTLGLARRVVRLSPGSRIEHVSVPRSDVLARTPSIEKARKLLGFAPRVDLDTGLARTLEWFRPGARGAAAPVHP